MCLDGAEQLGRVAWMMFRWRTRRAGGVLITSHRSGLLPTLIECATSPELLDRIVSRLAPPADDLRMPEDLFARHQGNVREALRERNDVRRPLTLFAGWRFVQGHGGSNERLQCLLIDLAAS